MLSGIGPKEHLKSVGIQPKIDLPVGKNLIDHLAVLFMNILINKTAVFVAERDLCIQSLMDYIFNRRGPLTSAMGLVNHAFISTSEVLKAGRDWPDIQIYSVAKGPTPSELASVYGFKQDILERFLEPGATKDQLYFMPTLGRVLSKGEITLKDRNPLSPPLIDPHYLEHPQDVKALVEGMKFVVKLLQTPAFHELNASIVRRMGRTTDPRSVVDSKLRVLDTKGLRVADASIMPELVNGNTNAPTIMIGEKVSDFIRDYWFEQYLICDKLHRFLSGTDNQCFYLKLV
ncbi:unnamed protein product [Allacma fusca]|uniref:Glucose-methanol-choline oxidoreductase C-terminal domain-containing protein n=1 Tax=Allacma fusca TaxID=39272 RepID=A0A8J2L7P3_9HEXA|nr:unnamed protein product [Allacma fusca]